MGVNKQIILGRVGKVDDLKSLTNSKVIKFTVAVSESYKNKNGEKVEQTEWFDCEAWNRLAEIIESYVEKGREIYVEGKTETQTWESEGTKHYKKIVKVSSIQLIGSKKDQASPAKSKEDELLERMDNPDELAF